MSEEQKETKHNIACPCCGKPTFQLPVQVDQESKQYYISCLLTGVPYKKTYKLFGGQVQVTLTEAEPSTLDKLTRLSALTAIEENNQKKAVMSDLVTRLYRYITIVQIIVRTQDNEVHKPVQAVVSQVLTKAIQGGTLQQITSLYNRLMSPDAVGTIPSLILDKLIVTHNRVLELFVASGFDASFYEGIPHGC